MGNRAGRLIKTYQSPPHQRGTAKPKFLAAKQMPKSIAAKTDPRLGEQFGYTPDLPQYVNETPHSTLEQIAQLMGKEESLFADSSKAGKAQLNLRNRNDDE